MNKQAPMKSSQTMPQLFYTRQDIQEQYLSATANSTAPLTKLERQVAREKRSRSSDPKQKQLRGNNELGEGEEEDSSEELDESGARKGRGRATGGRKRQRRSQSASIFSGCFSIPNLSSMLASSNQNHTSKRSILAQLGLSSGSSNATQQVVGGSQKSGGKGERQQQRPISSSQTLGNLQQVVSEDCSGGFQESPSQMGARKHVSFVGRQTNNSNNNNNNNNSTNRSNSNDTRTRQQQQQMQQQNSRPSTVIMRNYQAHPAHAQQQQQQPQPQPQPQLNMTATVPSSSQQRAIYLVSQQPTNGAESLSRQGKQVIYHTHHPVSSLEPRTSTKTSINSSTMSPQAGQQQLATTNTIYRRLPTVPKRTQATQTEITAYHLMSTSPLSSAPSTSTVMTAAPRRRLSSEHSCKLSAQAQAQVNSPTATLPLLTNIVDQPTSCRNGTSTFNDSPPGSLPKVTKEPSRKGKNIRTTNEEEDGSDEWSVDEEEENGKQPEGEFSGNLLNVSTLNSSSCSSSSNSLVGHDSTLANSLQYGKLEEWPDDDEMSSGSRKVVANAEVKGNKRNKEIVRAKGDDDGASINQVDGGKKCKVVAKAKAKVKAKSRGGNSGTEMTKPKAQCQQSSIEPPCQFKDTGGNVDGKPETGPVEAIIGAHAMIMAPELEEKEGMNMDWTTGSTVVGGGLLLNCNENETGIAALAEQLARAPSPPSISEASSQTTDCLLLDSSLANQLMGAASIESSSLQLKLQQQEQQQQISIANSNSNSDPNFGDDYVVGADNKGNDDNHDDDGDGDDMERDICCRSGSLSVASRELKADDRIAIMGDHNGLVDGGSCKEKQRGEEGAMGNLLGEHLNLEGQEVREQEQANFPVGTMLAERRRDDFLARTDYELMVATSSGCLAKIERQPEVLISAKLVAPMQTRMVASDELSSGKRQTEEEEEAIVSCCLDSSSGGVIPVGVVEQVATSEEAANGASCKFSGQQTIRGDCKEIEGAFMMASGDHKTGQQQEEEVASSLSVRLLEEATEAVSVGATNLVVGCRSSSSSSMAVAAAEEENSCSSASLSSCSGLQEVGGSREVNRENSERRSLKSKGDSPPTTVSELDEEEELSTPSFVDNYKLKLGQVHEFAGLLAEDLLQDCLLSQHSSCPPEREDYFEQHKPLANNRPSIGPSLAGSSLTELPVCGDSDEKRPSMGIDVGQEQKQEQEEEQKLQLDSLSAETNPPSSSSTVASIGSSAGADLKKLASMERSFSSSSGDGDQSSTTSPSGRSYACCHPKDQAHLATLDDRPSSNSNSNSNPDSKPEPPAKPAHLRERRAGEQAAAVAVTATSLAAAAAVASCSSVVNSAKLAIIAQTGSQPPEATSGKKIELEEWAKVEIEVDGGTAASRAASDLAAADKSEASEASEQTEESETSEREEADSQASNETDGDGQTANVCGGGALVSRSGSVCSAVSVISRCLHSNQQQVEKQQQTVLDLETIANVNVDVKANVGAQSGSFEGEEEEAALTEVNSESCRAENVSQTGSDGSGTEEIGGGVNNEQQQQQQLEQDELVIRQSSSQDLSTVSEVSEEMSERQLVRDPSETNEISQARLLLLKKLAKGNSEGSEAANTLLSGPKDDYIDINNVANDLGTDQDLARSEYTLQSQASETATWAPPPSDGAVSGGGSDYVGDGEGEGEEVAGRRMESGSESYNGSSKEETAPRRHLASQVITSSNNKQSQQQQRLIGSKSPIDCPFVADLLSLSPPEMDGGESGRQTQEGNSSNLPGLLTHHQRLSHDDTMEAIEDDVEGEELELEEQQKWQQHQDPLTIAPPSAFGGSGSPQSSLEKGDSIETKGSHRICTPADSIQEEEEEEEEESSISVSQHGVVIVSGLQEPNLKRLKAHSSSGSSISSASSTPTSGGVKQTSVEHMINSKGSSMDEHQVVAVEESGKQLISKTNSSELTTQAILEHLSLHHSELPLDEPAPALEQSRSVQDPQLRRESWRRGSTSMGRQTVANNEELDGTETMRRKQPKTVVGLIKNNQPISNDEQKQQQQQQPPASGELEIIRRGPPLSQLRGVEESSKQAQVHSSSVDTSICSSCSCLDANLEVNKENVTENQQVTSVVEKTTELLQQKQQQSSSQQIKVDKNKATWMSQEEGTVFTENYWLSHWLYISEREEAEIWRRAIDMSSGTSVNSTSERETSELVEQLNLQGIPKNMSEFSSTSSERNFSAKYKSTTRKMIHRRATVEMYKRIMSNNLKCEKRVEISRSNGEFGFRIHGSRPVVVSAIERGTSAETCGLQVGDLIYAINGTNILDMAHSDVVRLAHNADPSSLVLDLVPTNDFLKTSKYNKPDGTHHEPIVTGHLMRLSPSTAQPLLIELQEAMANASGVSSQQRAAKLNEVMRLAWRRRYFALRSDNCLYWYKSESDIEPFGGINLQGFSASLTNEFSEPSYVIRLVKYGGQPHYLGTNNVCDIQTWIDTINKAATEANQNDPYMKSTLLLARCKPEQVPDPDCSGYLYKFSHKRSGGAHWRAAYFILKDACLYLFRDQTSELVNQASAVYYLHGYRVRSKHIENKRHTFELMPPNRKTIRPMYLMASSETDKKRWIAALEYSIDRWLEID